MNRSQKISRTLLELKNINAGYGANIVLRDINLAIREQDFIGIVGPNGSGKTTLLKVILGLITPLSGDILYFDNGRITDKPGFGYMPQISHFDNEFPITVAEVAMSGSVSRLDLARSHRKEARLKAANILERLGVLQLKNQPIGELSGGQMQRVFLARALITSPQILILDEPDSYVDAGFENDLYDLLSELNSEMAILLVSHDLGTISSHVKAIACVNRTLYFHDSHEITQEVLESYCCPIDLITHGKLPHRVLRAHPSATGKKE